MIYGHGDDLYSYPDIVANFSSNCFTQAKHSTLIDLLEKKLDALISSYPHPEANDLKERISKKYRLTKSVQVSCFNGATEAIYMIARAFSGKLTYIAGPTFSEYESASYQNTSPVVHLSLMDLIKEQDCGLKKNSCCWICNPNNPDGSVFPKEKLKALAAKNPDVWFIVDQSYADFTNEPVLDDNELPDNMLLIFSLTKQYAIPGLRLGYIIGKSDMILKIERFRMPWSVNSIAIEAGKFLLDQSLDFAPIRKELFDEKNRLINALQDIGHIIIFPSQTHYFLAKLEIGCVRELKDFLARRHKILIRNAENFSPNYQNYFRIAVQTSEMNNILIKGIQQYVSNLQ
ncbi:MAG: pyridoxal phosphate-dependent aminotransferase [Bacteroidales bacterium]